MVKTRSYGGAGKQRWIKTDFKPWGLQHSLKKKRILNEGDIKILAANIKDLRTRALFILTYLTAGRMSELVYEIKKKDLIFKYTRGRSVLLVNMPNRKHLTRHFKDIPIPVDKESVLLELLTPYLKSLNDDDVLFPFGLIRAYQLIRDSSGFNNHWLRHLRLTHLVLYHDFNEQLLVRFAGWTNSLPAKSYMEIRWSDILDKY